MAPAEHTFDQKCRQKPVIFPEREDGMPPIEAQFFYSSTIPIDDPLSANINTGPPDKRSIKRLLRPFGRGDNNALEGAWLALGNHEDRIRHKNLLNEKPKPATAFKTDPEERDRLVHLLAEKHSKQHAGPSRDQHKPARRAPRDPDSTTELCCPGLHNDISKELAESVCSLSRAADVCFEADKLAKDISAIVLSPRTSANEQSHAVANATKTDIGKVTERGSSDSPSPSMTLQPRRGHGSSSVGSEAIPISGSRQTERSASRGDRSGSQISERSGRHIAITAGRDSPRHSLGDDGITGKPFVRVDNAEPAKPSVASSVAREEATSRQNANADGGLQTPGPEQRTEQGVTVPSNPATREICRAEVAEAERYLCHVTVGISRLHMVVLPSLQMKPIYWSPVNDMAVVIRATWFYRLVMRYPMRPPANADEYRDTMLPVSPTVANQLEAGYQELRPWTDTWIDELRCALEVGAAGEEKVSHELWPGHYKPLKGTNNEIAEPRISADRYCAARCFQGDAAAQGSIDTPGAETLAPNRPFANYHVVYQDERVGFLLKPSLKPSAYYGRRPVAKILRGITVGIPVVRGFSRRLWNKIHGSKNARGSTEEAASVANEAAEEVAECPACKAEKDRGQITDLVLVAHGIGQKFAERVESFHFTHAINLFRRAVNIELGNPTVKKVLREDQNGLMILPLNWRMGLSFADGGPVEETRDSEHLAETFDLKDIEPSTIPAVRSMMSDVMFDIPFYMSHHKGKMITALVSEANRVFRLWCQNNPGFSDKGRVHLIAHSLGSVMTIDILSRQPTKAPKLNLSLSTPPSTVFFEFDTTDLFLVGSPVAFFLLLERGSLIPRQGRHKVDADRNNAIATAATGEAGTFGCLAVDNLYNVLAKEDPIAYLLTGAIDPGYAAGLKTAYVPSTATSLMKSMGSAIRQMVPGVSPAPDPLAVEPERPSTVRLPSQLELEVHDFTREEIAEQKAYLLNDNGQIDWFLRSTGGPLEIQYLNMLSAHTSYWTNQDFIRMICLEIGRKPGRKNTLPAMRAVKATKTDGAK